MASKVPTIQVGAGKQVKVIEPVMVVGLNPTTGEFSSVGPGEARNYATVDLSSVDYTSKFDAIHVLVSGAVAIRGDNGNDITFTTLDVGLWPYGGQRILKTGTTATLIAISK